MVLDFGTVPYGETEGIDYTTTGQLAGRLTNNTGADIDLSNGRLDAEFALTHFQGWPSGGSSPPPDPGIEVDLEVRQSDGTLMFFSALRSITEAGIFTLSDTVNQASGNDSIWANGATIILQWVLSGGTPNAFMNFEVRRYSTSYTQERFDRSNGLQPPFLYPPAEDVV